MIPISAGQGVRRIPGANTLSLSTFQREKPARRPAAEPRTFYTTGSGANVIVSAGAINSIIVPETTLAPSNGHVVYLRVTVNTSGVETAVAVLSAASLPANTSTLGHTPLATVAVSGGIATPTPLAWNYSQMQKCGPTTYLWGGFGS